MPYINVNDVYIMDNTGKQVDDAVDYALANSNRNLLDNPWFTVNQRGVNGTITNGQYGLDRWMVGGGTVTMATGGITLGAGNSYALQRPADPSIFNGKTVTLSVMTSDGVVESGTVVAQTGSAKTVRTANFELCIGYTAYNSFYFYNTSSSAKTVIAAKLELGSYSTLANDVPPDYGEELLKCQRYFYRMDGSAANYTSYGLCVAVNTTTAELFVNTPVVMRATPTVSYSGTFQLRDYAGGNTRGISAMGVDTRAATTLKVAITAASLTLGWIMQLRGASSATYIDFSADL